MLGGLFDFGDPDFVAADIAAELAAEAAALEPLPVPEGAPEFVRVHRVVMVNGKATCPGGVRPWFHHWESPGPEQLARPGDVFVTDDLAELSICLPRGEGGRATVVRRVGLVGQPDVERHEDGTLSLGLFVVKTVMRSHEADRFKIERGRIVYL